MNILSIPGMEGHFLDFWSCLESFPQTYFLAWLTSPGTWSGLNEEVLHQLSTPPPCDLPQEGARTLPQLWNQQVKFQGKWRILSKGHLLTNVCIKKLEFLLLKVGSPGSAAGGPPGLWTHATKWLPGVLTLESSRAQNLHTSGLGFPSSLRQSGRFWGYLISNFPWLPI